MLLEQTPGPAIRKRIKENQLTIVLFSASWNGACQIIAPIFESLAEAYSNDAAFCVVDADEEKALTESFGLMEYPAILFFRKGVVVGHSIGLISKLMLAEKIQTAVSHQS